MLITAALMAASLSVVQDEDFVLPDMPDVDTATQEDIQAYLDLLRNFLGQIDDVDSFGAHWSRFITEGAELTSSYRVRDPYILTAVLTRIYDDVEEAMPRTDDVFNWALGMDFDLERRETLAEDGAELVEAELLPLPERFCEDGEHTVIEDETAPFNQRLDLCLAHGPDPDGDGYVFAEAQVIHRYVHARPTGHEAGYFDIQAAASLSDEHGLLDMRIATRDLAQAVAEQLQLEAELVRSGD
jgi:hypothetical protein